MPKRREFKASCYFKAPGGSGVYFISVPVSPYEPIKEIEFDLQGHSSSAKSFFTQSFVGMNSE